MSLYHTIQRKAYNLYINDYKNVVVLIRPIDYTLLVSDPDFMSIATQMGLPQMATLGGPTLKVFGYPIIITDAIPHMLILHDDERI